MRTTLAGSHFVNIFLHSCVPVAGVTCPPGQGAVNGVCVPCGDNQVSPGGQGAMCTPCPANQAPNAANSSCVAAGKRWRLAALLGRLMLH